jgi:hypothetical protein
MRASIVKAVLVACTVAFTVAVPAAQDKPADQAKPAGKKEHTMTGCLQKGDTADTYVVMNTAEKGPKTISIVETTAKLAPHVGHKIDITGTDIPVKEAQSMKTAPPKGDHYMRVTAIKMVSATCP